MPECLQAVCPQDRQTLPRRSRPCTSQFHSATPCYPTPSQHGPQGSSSLCTRIPARTSLVCFLFPGLSSQLTFFLLECKPPSSFHLFIQQTRTEPDTVWAEEGWESLSLLPPASWEPFPSSTLLSSELNCRLSPRCLELCLASCHIQHYLPSNTWGDYPAP